MKNIIIVVIMLFIAIGYFRTHKEITTTIVSAPLAVKDVIRKELHKVNPTDKNLLRNGQFGKGYGHVIRVFHDSHDHGNFQLFNIRLESGESMLIKHNIDIAPKIKNLQAGDAIEFYGIYERHIKRGVITSTHHDPKHQGKDGWIKHRGKTYQ